MTESGQRKWIKSFSSGYQNDGIYLILIHREMASHTICVYIVFIMKNRAQIIRILL